MFPQAFPQRRPRKAYPFLRQICRYTPFTPGLPPDRAARRPAAPVIHAETGSNPGPPSSVQRRQRTHFCGRWPETVPNSARRRKTAALLPLRTCFCGVPDSALACLCARTSACVPISASRFRSGAAASVPDSASMSGGLRIDAFPSFHYILAIQKKLALTLNVYVNRAPFRQAYLFLRVNPACTSPKQVDMPGTPWAPYLFLREKVQTRAERGVPVSAGLDSNV